MQFLFALQPVRIVCALSLIALAGVLPGCSQKVNSSTEYKVGDKVIVGSLTYNVLETQWKSQIGTFPTARLPQRNFLLVHVSVTNGGGQELSLPMFSIENT